jgi:hypothetical protein
MCSHNQHHAIQCIIIKKTSLEVTVNKIKNGTCHKHRQFSKTKCNTHRYEVEMSQSPNRTMKPLCLHTYAISFSRIIFDNFAKFSHSTMVFPKTRFSGQTP